VEMENVLQLKDAMTIIHSLKKFPLKEVGSARWFHQQENMEKLRMQAVLDASVNRDGFVKELLFSLGKIPTLVHSLITVEIWKQKIFSLFCKLQDLKSKCGIPLCMVIYHEDTLITLLEDIIYHENYCEAADDVVVDLVDYCHRKLTLLIGKTAHSHQTFSSVYSVNAPLWSGLRHCDSHNAYFSHSFRPSVLSRLLCTHNFPCVLVQLVEHSPWSRQNGDRLEKYVDGNWREVRPEDQLKISKQDGHVWIALLNLLLRPECHSKYDFNDFNKSQLLKLRQFLPDVVIDQLPRLSHLLSFLMRLTFTDPAPPQKNLFVEEMPEIWDSIMEENLKNTFNPSKSELTEQAARLHPMYKQYFPEESSWCGFCGNMVSKRCSRCQLEWYCSRECQVKHWPKHKVVCQKPRKEAV
uniref:MYND-type domain-containing protein n=1 Tax=Denticeps clupeoides TaxID=299321 RepID=A0AAY4EHN0_9TELE